MQTPATRRTGRAPATGGDRTQVATAPVAQTRIAPSLLESDHYPLCFNPTIIHYVSGSKSVNIIRGVNI
jgi:hypothetical protein